MNNAPTINTKIIKPIRHFMIFSFTQWNAMKEICAHIQYRTRKRPMRGSYGEIHGKLSGRLPGEYYETNIQA